MRKTKIVCTLGPASDSEEIIEQLILSGMDAARFNFSHGTHESQLATYTRLCRVRDELGRPVAICIGLGTNAGSHDGVGVFEEYLGGVSIQKGVCLCAAAGNEAEARHHTGGVLEPGEKPGQIDLKVGDAAGDVYLAIWNTVAGPAVYFCAFAYGKS